MISRQRLFTCALINTPETVRVIRIVNIRNKTNGKAYTHPDNPEYGCMWAPRPVTRAALFIFLHECSHFTLHLGEECKPRYFREWEAETWALGQMRAARIPVPRESLWRARRRVACHIVREMTWIYGAEIDPRAARFAWGKHWKARLKRVEEQWEKEGSVHHYFHPDDPYV